MSIEGQGHFFTIYFPGFVCFVLYLAKISGERLQDHWSSGFIFCNSEGMTSFPHLVLGILNLSNLLINWRISFCKSFLSSTSKCL